MKHPLALLAAVAGAALVLSGSRDSEGGGASPVPRRVLLVGDSHAVGLRVPLGDELTRGGWSFAADARGGTSALQWRAWIGPALGAHAPDLVLVSLGGNDFQTSRPADVSTAIGDIARQIQAIGAALWWLDPRLEGSSLVDRVGVVDWWRAVAARVLVAGPTVTIAADAIHATAQGYRNWAADIAAAFGVVA